MQQNTMCKFDCLSETTWQLEPKNEQKKGFTFFLEIIIGIKWDSIGPFSSLVMPRRIRDLLPD